MRLFVLITVSLLLSSCSFEQDTRLVCNYEKGNAGGVLYNAPLIFNESKKKFNWNGTELNIPDLRDRITYSDDYIILDFRSTMVLRNLSFELNRTNLEFRRFDYSDAVGVVNFKTTIYQCVKVEGV